MKVTCPHCVGQLAENARDELSRHGGLVDRARLTTHWSCLLCAITGKITIRLVKKVCDQHTLIEHNGVVWEAKATTQLGQVPEVIAAAYRMAGLKRAQELRMQMVEAGEDDLLTAVAEPTPIRSQVATKEASQPDAKIDRSRPDEKTGVHRIRHVKR